MYRLYVITHDQSDQRESWHTVIAVFLGTEPPNVLLVRQGSVYEVKQQFSNETIALRWWIQNGERLNVLKDCTKVAEK